MNLIDKYGVWILMGWIVLSGSMIIYGLLTDTVPITILGAIGVGVTTILSFLLLTGRWWAWEK